MILINKNANNNVVVTLNENTTINNPIYTLLIYSNENTTQTLITLTNDITNNTTRYNHYILNDPNDIDLPVGWYDYFIFETDPLNTFNQGTDNIIEIGKFKVKDIKVSTPTFDMNQVPTNPNSTPNSNNQDYYTFE